MIRIVYCKTRSSKDYAILSIVLNNGLQQFCINDCDNCVANTVCKNVKSASKYALKLAHRKVETDDNS